MMPATAAADHFSLRRSEMEQVYANETNLSGPAWPLHRGAFPVTLVQRARYVA
jgi:hypothetical protein